MLFFKKPNLSPDKDLTKVNETLVDANITISNFICEERYAYRRNALHIVLSGKQGVHALRALAQASQEHALEGQRKGYDWSDNLYQNCLDTAVPNKKMQKFLLSLPDEWLNYLEPTGMFSVEQYLDSIERQVIESDRRLLSEWDARFSSACK